MRRSGFAAALVLISLVTAGGAVAHFDHPVPGGSPSSAPASTVINAGGENAEWELLATIPTGNPHSDLDFFTHKGETYVSVGTLGTGANQGGQTIVRLTQGGEVSPEYVTGHPSAGCPTGSSSVTGLQHDVEATPKGATILNAPNPFADTGDAELLVDSTDAPGRCHDQGPVGVSQTGQVPQGGLEIIDITDPAQPKELALTSHIGNAHTVNVDPKRPHIAFDVTQDGMLVNDQGQRENEVVAADFNDLDGFEVVDMSSCMGFPPGTPLEAKRQRCRPQVYRYRYESAHVAQSHTYPALQSCHEVEIYADDTLACSSITSTILFDLSGAFDDNGTPADYTDDRPRGTPLPCKPRESSSPGAPLKTGAIIIDCVNGEVNGQAQSLNIPEWLKMGAPSLQGVRWIGTVHHMGFRPGSNQNADLLNAPFPATEDIIAAHESELTGSGRFVLTTDERGGGVIPVGASCSPGVDNTRGNGGIHAFPVRAFVKPMPASAEEAQRAYAKTSKGERAIYRAPIRTQPEGSFCTAHVFQQIPGQNRIFMGWYSQGTEVVDFVEGPDGTFDFKQAAYFTPENANTWVSHVFRVVENADGTFTYFGVASDGILPATGRGAIDVYKVTLPAPPKPAGRPQPGTPSFPPPSAPSLPPCARSSGFDAVSVRPRGRGVRFAFRRAGGAPVRVDLLRGKRRVRSFGNRRRSFTFRGRLRDGYYVARFRVRAPDGTTDVRRVAVRRVRGRFRSVPAFEARRACGLVEEFALAQPVFRGPLRLSFRLGESARVTVEVRRGARLVKRFRARNYARGRTHRLRVGARRGPYRVTLKAERPGRSSTLTLRARRL